MDRRGGRPDLPRRAGRPLRRHPRRGRGRRGGGARRTGAGTRRRRNLPRAEPPRAHRGSRVVRGRGPALRDLRPPEGVEGTGRAHRRPFPGVHHRARLRALPGRTAPADRRGRLRGCLTRTTAAAARAADRGRRTRARDADIGGTTPAAAPRFRGDVGMGVGRHVPCPCPRRRCGRWKGWLGPSGRRSSLCWRLNGRCGQGRWMRSRQMVHPQSILTKRADMTGSCPQKRQVACG